MKQLLFFWILVFCSFWVKAQDIHYTQFDWIPMLLNPGLSGYIPGGDMQYGLIYRDQGFTVTPNSYKSFSVFADVNIQKGFSKNDFLGIAALFTHDNAGTGSLSTDEILINAAYHFSISEKQLVSLGVQAAYIRRAFGNFDAFSFEEELNGGVFSEFVDPNDRQYLDVNGGITFTSSITEHSHLQTGISLYHLNHSNPIHNPNYLEKFEMKYTSFLKLKYWLTAQLEIEPKVLYQHAQKSKELIVQGMVGYKLSNRKDLKLKAGFGWRQGDAIQFLLGAEFGNWEAGFAYDANISSLSAVSNPVAGIEFGIKYTHTRPKKNKFVELPLPLFLEPKEPVLTWERYIELAIDSMFNQLQQQKDDYVFDNKGLKPILSTDPNKMLVFRHKPIKLENIYYNYDSKRILPDAEKDLSKLLTLMNKYPNMVIELSSHTDARGDDRYNRRLSQGRAESAKRWLVKKGISAKRIIAKGKGEQYILNHCKNGVKCSDKKHRENRRTEFTIIEGPEYIWFFGEEK